MSVITVNSFDHGVRGCRSHDFPQLNEDIVANSNTWYNRWVADEVVQQNMSITFECMRSNTDLNLWNKCYDRYSEFESIQQGGPLIAHLVLHAIQDASEQSLESLVC